MSPTIAKAIPYLKVARVNRPYGIWLLVLPAWCGLVLGFRGMPPLSTLGLFLTGAFLTRSGGCIYNDLIDKDFDRHVRRTASRPLVTGEVSPSEAILLIALFLGLACGILWAFPGRIGILATLTCVLIGAYPWMKRITYWPQLFLGFTYNMGLLMGWFVATPTLSWVPFLFYGGAIFWTLGYDTIYALQDREDDEIIGVKSAAIRMATSLRLFLSSVYGLALIFWAIGGYRAGLSTTYWVFWTLIGFHFASQLFSLSPQNAEKCLKSFKSNTFVGILLFLGLVLSFPMN